MALNRSGSQSSELGGVFARNFGVRLRVVLPRTSLRGHPVVVRASEVQRIRSAPSCHPGLKLQTPTRSKLSGPVWSTSQLRRDCWRLALWRGPGDWKELHCRRATCSFLWKEIVVEFYDMRAAQQVRDAGSAWVPGSRPPRLHHAVRDGGRSRSLFRPAGQGGR